MTQIYGRVHCSAAGQETVVGGRWLPLDYLPRIGEEVNLLPDDEWLSAVVGIEYWPEDKVVVLKFSLDLDCGSPGSWARDQPGVDFHTEVLAEVLCGRFEELSESCYFPAYDIDEQVGLPRGRE